MRAVLALLAVTAVALAQDPLPAGGLWHIPASKASPAARSLPPGVRLALPAPAVTALSSVDERAARAANRRGDIPIGIERPAVVVGSWTGSVWRASVQSPGARAIRIRFRAFDAGSASVWVYAPNAEPNVYTTRGPFADGAFWSADVDGDTAIIEYEGPGDTPPFVIDSVAHLFESLSGPPQVAACQLDYQCYPQWREPGRAVATITFQSDADRSFYVCSGALLNTRASSLTPYFLTANHCIATDNEARSLQAYWFYETAACNGAEPAKSQATRVNGARLLATAPFGEGDWSLLLLNGLPQQGVYFAGWNPIDPAFGSAVTGIHHPGGSWKRITFGQRSADSSANVGGEFAPANQFYQVLETDGRTEGGSSGSPLFDAAQRVIGTLSYGPAARPGQSICDVSTFRGGYGRFSVAYPKIREFLEDQPPPQVSVSPQLLRFTVTAAGSTPDRADVRVESSNSTSVAFTAESSAPWLVLSAASGTIPAGGASTISVSIDATKFIASGQYSATLTIRAGTAAPLNVAVVADVSLGQSRVAVEARPDPVYERAPDADGYRWFYELRLTERAGVATRLTRFVIDGVDQSSRISSFFGTGEIAAFGSISTGLRTRGLTVPATRVFEFGGVDAGGGQWTARITLQFLGPLQRAGLRVTITPNPVAQDPNSSDCAWRHEVVVTEENGFAVDLNRWVAGGNDLSDDIAGWFRSARVPASGTLRATLCWRGVVVPATVAFEVAGKDERGNDVGGTAEARFTGVSSAEQTVVIAPERVVLRGLPGQNEILRATINVRAPAGAAWSARWESPAPAWATAAPLAGVGPGSIVLQASSASLNAGQFTAALFITVAGGTPPEVRVPVELTSSIFTGGAARLDAMVNAASFRPGLAPGGLFSIFGEGLAAAEAVAQAIPLPFTLGGATVRVNGVVAPLWYVSQRQMNVQLPYSTAAGRATIVVNVEGRESSLQVDVTPIAPGVFTLDGQRPTPQPSGPRGGVLIAYVTGAGAVSPAVRDGNAPAGVAVADLPRPLGTVRVTVAGIGADVLFAGLPPGVVGAIQINFRVPPDAPLGNQTMVVTVGGVVAQTVTLQVQ